MKTEPKFKVGVDREDVAEHLKGIDVLANLESNGKLEATFILKGC